MYLFSRLKLYTGITLISNGIVCDRIAVELSVATVAHFPDTASLQVLNNTPSTFGTTASTTSLVSRSLHHYLFQVESLGTNLYTFLLQLGV